MAPYGPTSYANAHSRVRILYAKLLSAQDFSNLMEAADYDALITQLKETAYGPYLSLKCLRLATLIPKFLRLGFLSDCGIRTKAETRQPRLK